jgi:hypothetical protein
METVMPKGERLDERAMVEHDKRTLERALADMRKRKKKSAGDRQIEAQLEEMAGAQDLEDPQRYHGS